jgi:hypothetical protein
MLLIGRLRTAREIAESSVAVDSPADSPVFTDTKHTEHVQAATPD